MPDPIFDHPRLAAIYDAFDGPRDDLAAYVAIADEFAARHVLDVGCGTGCLAVLLAATGRVVTGVDPSAASLEIARAKGGDGISYLHGDATVVGPIGADLAVMTGNVAQVFVTDAEWTTTLRAVRSALRPGGHFVFETRRPAYRAWEEWAADDARVTKDLPGIGPVEQSREVTEVNLPYVSFRYTYHFHADGAVVVSDSTLRFRDRPELEATLTETGYRVLDVRQAPDRPDREYVFVTERP
ncbi:MAG TPA: class I SAM-dependent methyltransferase [Pseudonocardiaceae bacterium]|nr:class I SAM-dependent methyltransferase [Pseudonocardiaceae bacterium]